MPEFDIDAALQVDEANQPVLSPCCGTVLLFSRMHWPDLYRGEAPCRCATCHDEFLVTYECDPEEAGANCPTDGQRVSWSGVVTAARAWPTVALTALYRHRHCQACGLTPVAYPVSGDPIPL